MYDYTEKFIRRFTHFLLFPVVIANEKAFIKFVKVYLG